MHVAWLRGGRKLALKVQHADIAPVMMQDLDQCDVLARRAVPLQPTPAPSLSRPPVRARTPTYALEAESCT